MSRPLDHIDSPVESTPDQPIGGPRLNATGWVRWAWRQLTSMHTALLLLLALAVAAIPGSLVPQRTADPNGVTMYFRQNPQLAPILDRLQAFDVYNSVWFSSIYLLLFLSLIGCIIPRTVHHLKALRGAPPRTPGVLSRLPAYASYRSGDLPARTTAESADLAESTLRGLRYRVGRFDDRGGARSVSAERGYLRETGNLVFHSALIGVLIAVGVGGGLGFSGQRVVVEGQSFVNSLASYDSFNPGRLFDVRKLEPYSLTLDSFQVDYEQRNLKALGQPIDYRAKVTATWQGGTGTQQGQIGVNTPLNVGSTNIYLLGNGYAPKITVRDNTGKVVFSDDIPFLPQDLNLTSLGIVKVPDGLPLQLGMIGFLYPTQRALPTGAYTSVYPDLTYPLLTLNVYSGDLGLNTGAPKSVYALDTSKLTQLTGGKTGVKSIELAIGATAPLPGGMGTVTLEGVKRFASFDVTSNPGQGWVLLFALLAIAGLFTSLLVPRRRMWVRVFRRDEETIVEVAGLARGDDPRLDAAVADLGGRVTSALGGTWLPAAAPPQRSSGSRNG